MRRILFLLIFSLGLKLSAITQVMQLSSNNRLQMVKAIGPNKLLLIEGGTSKLWITDATTSGTFKLSDTLSYDGAGGMLNDEFVFAATSPNLGSELWITDGTVAGTRLVKDIYPGKTGAEPHDNFALLNGYLYFSASSSANGRELWRTNGTPEGTTEVKDIVPGPAGSGLKNTYKLFSTGTYLLFTTPTYTEGYELWRSDGTAEGTYLLKDINPGVASSELSVIQMHNNLVLFQAKTAAQGTELWRTDGTAGGTQLVKDIRPGSGSSFNHLAFHSFNNKLFFAADDGTTGEELWTTDGTEQGTVLLKDINPGNARPFVSLDNMMQVDDALLFFAYKEGQGSELWKTDGTPMGTSLFKEVLPGIESGIPFLMPNTGSKTFYFLMGLPLGGVDLWKSDGTVAGTVKLKNIKTSDNKIENVSFVYTSTAFYFSVDDGVHGHELWKSDGTVAGTMMFADINNGKGDSNIRLWPFVVKKQVVFEATNGDNEYMWDLYTLGGNLIPLPVKLELFTVSLNGADAQLRWQTATEENMFEFAVERSIDGKYFTRIGSVAAAGISTENRAYLFNDATVASLGKKVIYYRLVMKERNATESLSNVITLNVNVHGDFSMQLLGNPVQFEMKLSFAQAASPINLGIHDASGRRLKTMQVKNEEVICSVPVGQLLPGVYFLRAECNGQSSVVKFIKL